MHTERLLLYPAERYFKGFAETEKSQSDLLGCRIYSKERVDTKQKMDCVDLNSL